MHLKHTQEAGRALGVRVVPLEVRTAVDYDTVFTPIAGDPVGALLMFNDFLTLANWKRVADFALASRTPTVCEFRFQAHGGCLVSYGPPSTNSPSALPIRSTASSKVPSRPTSRSSRHALRIGCQSEDRQGTRHLDSKLSAAARGCGDRMNSTRRTNRLERETSPYLLQHAFNPVDWYPWGDEAFAKARSEDKPVLREHAR